MCPTLLLYHQKKDFQGILLFHNCLNTDFNQILTPSPSFEVTGVSIPKSFHASNQMYKQNNQSSRTARSHEMPGGYSAWQFHTRLPLDRTCSWQFHTICSLTSLKVRSLAYFVRRHAELAVQSDLSQIKTHRPTERK